jgi:uncharacterized membrane protein
MNDFWNHVPEITLIVLGMLPISEVRGAILAGVFVFDMPLLKTYALAVFGNVLPIIPLLLFLERLVEFLGHRYYWLNRFFAWLFERTRQRHGDHFHHYRWAPLALFFFVAIPLPFTGAWSGVIAAIVFGIPLFQAISAIFAGIFAAGGIVLVLIHFGIFTAKFIL